MLRLAETVITQETTLRVELHDDLSYCLRYGNLVEYRDDRRTVRGKVLPYEFRSVEQLRYDFERDVRAVGGRLGENP
jgi:hypothetical protein